MRRLRVLFVSATLGVGGAERQWAVLIPELRRRGFEPSVLTLYDPGSISQELRRQSVTTESARMTGRTDLHGLVHAIAHARAGDVVVSQSFAGQVVAHAIAVRARVPHVTTEHHGPGLHRRIHERAVLRLLSPHVAAAVAVSPSQVSDLVDLGFRRERIRVIPNGIAELVARRSPEEVRRELGLPDDAFVAILAATLRPEKRAHLFVEAVARANTANGRVLGLIAGAGPELPRIEALARATDGAVRVLGQRSDVVDILGAADTVCLSSDTEALPMVVLEAMALGKPVVATDVGGISDAVEHEETGLLVRAGDPAELASALLRLADSPRLAMRLGGRARQLRATRFSSDRMVDDYARLLESVAVRPPSHSIA